MDAKVKVALPKDDRIDKCSKKLMLEEDDLVLLFSIFNRYDREGAGFISTIDLQTPCLT
jgi:hypothetical protein